MNAERNRGGRRASPNPRADLTRRSFLTKVELMERIAEGSPPPAGTPDLLSIGKFAGWEVAELGVFAWTSPNVVSRNGAHRDLRARYDAAAKQLKDARAKTPSKPRFCIAQLRSANQALAEQVLQLRLDLKNMARDLAIAEHDLDLARKREAALLNSTSKVTRIRPIK